MGFMKKAASMGGFGVAGLAASQGNKPKRSIISTATGSTPGSLISGRTDNTVKQLY